MARVPTRFVALVTGCTTATGRQVIRGLIAGGYAVVLVYLDDQRQTETVLDEVQAAGGTAVAVRADLGDEFDVERLFRESIAVFERADLIVHLSPQSDALLYAYASRHLHRGGAIIGVAGGGPAAGAARLLWAREVTIAGVASGRRASSAHTDAADLLALVDRWHDRTHR